MMDSNKIIASGLFAFLAFAVVAGLIAVLIYTQFLSEFQDFGSPSAANNEETKWSNFLKGKNLLMNDSLNVSIGKPQEVAPGIVSIRVEETFKQPALGDETSVIFVKTKYVYVDINTSEAIVLGYSLTTLNAKEEAREILNQQLDPSSMNYSMDGYVSPD